MFDQANQMIVNVVHIGPILYYKLGNLQTCNNYFINDYVDSQSANCTSEKLTYWIRRMKK